METRLAEIRNTLEQSGELAEGIVSEPISDSWRRCLDAGLDPLGRPEEHVVSLATLNEKRERLDRVVKLIRPELELLGTQISGSNFLVAFADSDGVVLDQILDNEFHGSGCAKSLVPGSVWNENVCGTNGIGLSLRSGHSSIVTGSEHFFRHHSNISCVASPVFDSLGNLIGSLDATSEISARQHHTRVLVGLAATNMENRLFIEDHRNHIILQLHAREEYLATQSVCMIALNEVGKIMGVNRRATVTLTGLGLDIANHFSDLFQDQFRPTMDKLFKGDVVKISDWLQSSYFARLRPTYSAQIHGRASQVLLPIGPVSQSDSAKLQNDTIGVFEDEAIRFNLNLALRSARMGLPIVLRGKHGTGKKTLAREIHKRVRSDKIFVSIDCQTTGIESIENVLVANAHYQAEEPQATETTFDLNAGGTLFLETVDLAHPELIPLLNTLLNRLTYYQSKQGSNNGWIVLSSTSAESELRDLEPNDIGESLLGRLFGFELILPTIEKRSDFHKLARYLMASISPRHTLSKSALDVLQSMDWSSNLHSLSRALRIIAVRHQEVVVRDQGIHRFLISQQNSLKACKRCIGHRVKEASCIQIQATLLDCNGNVALAARQLGVSRNTVYSHRREICGSSN